MGVFTCPLTPAERRGGFDEKDKKNCASRCRNSQVSGIVQLTGKNRLPALTCSVNLCRYFNVPTAGIYCCGGVAAVQRWIGERDCVGGGGLSNVLRVGEWAG